MKKCLFFVLFTTMLAWAEGPLPDSQKLMTDFDPRRDVISDKYEAGRYLIYDCIDKHWVCVMPVYYEACREQREEDVRLRKSHAQCAPIAEFDVKFSCFQEQLRLTGNVDAEKLCVLESWKTKEISL